MGAMGGNNDHLFTILIHEAQEYLDLGIMLSHHSAQG